MKFLRIIISIAAILSFNLANAQVTGRERNTNNKVVIRDSVSYRKIMIGEKYDSLINSCRSQIAVLNLEVKGLQNLVEDLKTQIKQAEQDYNSWLQNVQKSLTKEQLLVQSQQKQKELDKKISDLDKQIYSTNKNINTKGAAIKQLKSQIALLEKEKVAVLSKT